MKKMNNTMMILLALGVSALAARAQDDNTNQPPEGFHRHHPPMPALIRALDANHDGVIDSNEIANASAALLTLDKNGDGQLTRDEYMGRPPGGGPPEGQPGPPPADQTTQQMTQDTNNTNPPPEGFREPRGHRPLPLIVQALDANHDGVIDASEIANASAVLKTLDKNGDGVLTPDEFMGHRPMMGGPRGGDAGGPPPGGPDDQNDMGGPGGPPDGPGGDDGTPPQGPPPQQ